MLTPVKAIRLSASDAPVTAPKPSGIVTRGIALAGLIEWVVTLALPGGQIMVLS